MKAIDYVAFLETQIWYLLTEFDYIAESAPDHVSEAMQPIIAATESAMKAKKAKLYKAKSLTTGETGVFALSNKEYSNVVTTHPAWSFWVKL